MSYGGGQDVGRNKAFRASARTSVSGWGWGDIAPRYVEDIEHE